MKAILVGVLVAAAAHACAAQANNTAQCPKESGAYYYSQSAWKPMDITHSMGFKMTGLYTHAVKAIFRDNASPYQVNGSEPKFCLVGLIDSGRDLTLARFSPSKKDRELQFGKAGLTGFKMQISDKDTVPLNVEKIADKTYIISSKEPVAKGEYILLPILPNMATSSNQATNLSGYDLSVRAE